MPSEYDLVLMSRTSRHTRTRTALDGCSHGQGCTSSSTLTYITEDLQADISMGPEHSILASPEAGA